MSAVNHPLGFELSRLSIKKMAALFDALTTLQDVTASLMETGLFSQNDEASSAAYSMMDSLRDKFGWELCAIKAEAEQRECASADDAEAKFNILIMAASWGGERPSEIVAALAKAAADLDFEQGRAGRTGS